MCPLQHEGHVVPGLVVAVDRGLQFGGVGQVSACGAQVATGGDGGVVDVVGVGYPVAAGVNAPLAPG